MKRAAVLFGVTLLGLAALGVPADAHAAKGKKASVKIVNKSDWEIHHFFLSSTEDDEWGPDQLGDDVIGTGEAFTLKSIPCDNYDVKLIDEDDDECVVEDVDICGGSEQWTITNKILLGCQEASE
ncbi:MAG TPA: hypothetical protein VHC97_26760 [Thermoanaerobaculia bacterium]|jgi:hypothetical protein|nr:hypothetical protein [Thermoanaerobaculia bacterium]